MRTVTIAALVVLLGLQSAKAEDFRVTTKILQGDTVRHQSVTVFYKGRVYDDSHPKKQEFTIYDPTSRRIHLIDVQRKVQTAIPTDSLAEFTAELKARAPEVKSEFFINPKFEKSLEDNKLALRSAHITYEAELLPPRFQGASVQYRRFADWICQLNATNTANLPPFARLELNKAISTEKLVPRKVTLTLPIGSRERVVTSEHQYNWLLSRDDRELCETIGGYLADPEIRTVGFQEYRKSQDVMLGRSVSQR